MICFMKSTLGESLKTEGTVMSRLTSDQNTRLVIQGVVVVHPEAAEDRLGPEGLEEVVRLVDPTARKGLRDFPVGRAARLEEAGAAATVAEVEKTLVEEKATRKTIGDCL